MTGETQVARRLQQVGVIRRAVDVVAAEARDSALVHHALHEVVSLHAVLVRGAVGEVGEACFAQPVFLQLPVILQLPALVKADRPVEVASFDRVGQRLALRIEGVADCRSRWLGQSRMMWISS